MTWKLGRFDEKGRVDKTPDKLPTCPKCGGNASYGRCSSRKCGWKSDTRLAREAKRVPRKAYARKTNGVVEVLFKEERDDPALTYGKPLLLRSIVNQVGEVIMNEYRCPECKGKGWSTNAFDSCSLCLGHGTISDNIILLVNIRSGKVPL